MLHLQLPFRAHLCHRLGTETDTIGPSAHIHCIIKLHEKLQQSLLWIFYFDFSFPQVVRNYNYLAHSSAQGYDQYER